VGHRRRLRQRWPYGEHWIRKLSIHTRSTSPPLSACPRRFIAMGLDFGAHAEDCQAGRWKSVMASQSRENDLQGRSRGQTAPERPRPELSEKCLQVVPAGMHEDPEPNGLAHFIRVENSYVKIPQASASGSRLRPSGWWRGPTAVVRSAPTENYMVDGGPRLGASWRCANIMPFPCTGGPLDRFC